MAAPSWHLWTTPPMRSWGCAYVHAIAGIECANSGAQLIGEVMRVLIELECARSNTACPHVTRPSGDGTVRRAVSTLLRQKLRLPEGVEPDRKLTAYARHRRVRAL